MPEYYIRRPDSTESKGPYTPSQIASLAEAEQIDKEILYYDEEREAWTTIISNEDLAAEVFPQKKGLVLKAREAGPPPMTTEEDQGVSVEGFLAAAEGVTGDTKHVKAKAKSAEQAASISPFIMGTLFLFSAIGLIYPSIALIQSVTSGEAKWLELLNDPRIIIGGIDAILALACFLGATDAYPFARFRAALGLGFFGYFYWALGSEFTAISVVVGSLAIFICSLTLSVFWMIFFGAIGILGMLVYALLSFF